MSAYELDREMMEAWINWTEAELKAAEAKGKYDKLKAEFDKRLEEDQIKFEI